MPRISDRQALLDELDDMVKVLAKWDVTTKILTSCSTFGLVFYHADISIAVPHQEEQKYE